MKEQFIIFGIVVITFLLSGCFDNIFQNGNYGDIPIEQLKIEEKNVSLKYYLDGQQYFISYSVYGGLNDYLASLPREIWYYENEPTTKDFIMRDIDQKQQRELLMPLVYEIQNITEDKDDQVRVAVSIVQSIPYDWSGFYGILTGKYPYEVLYSQTGVCGEKSELLMFLLRELGYGVVSFEFDTESHRAVGIKCPLQYSYYNTGYCFVETASPTIITNSNSNYVGVGKLTTYNLILISAGSSFNSVFKEYIDAQEFDRLCELSDASGGILEEYDYNRWWNLVNKYGIEVR